MSGAVVKKCGCKGNPDHSSKYQDQKYGEGMRVCNVDLKKSAAACTVCGKEHKM